MSEHHPRILDGKFSCVCGKRFAWKPQLAGKRAKCACGTTIIIPETEESPPESPKDDEGSYDFAEPSPVQQTVRAIPVSQSVVTAPASSPAPAVEYRSAPTAKDHREADRFSLERTLYPPRDLYIPLGLLIAGFLAILAWPPLALGAGAEGVVIVAIATGVTTVIKTAIIIGIALLAAPWMGISFGDLRTAVLKFAAMVIFADAALIWLDVAMESLGAMRPGYISLRILAIRLFAAAVLYSAMAHYLFDMDRDETAMFALPLALISQVIGFGFKLLAVSILISLLG